MARTSKPTTRKWTRDLGARCLGKLMFPGLMRGGGKEVEAGLVSRLSSKVEAVHVGTWKAGGSKESSDQWG